MCVSSVNFSTKESSCSYFESKSFNSSIVISLSKSLLSLKDNVLVSARNINIIKDYINGMTLKETGRKYQISKGRVRAIASNYIAHCHQYLKRGYSMKKNF